MKHLHIRLLMVASAAFFIACSPAAAQWQTPDHSVPVGRGSGTGFKAAGPGTNNQALMGVTGADPVFRALVGADLPLPGTSSLGGVFSTAATSSQWLRSLGTDGAFTKSQPAFSDLSGSWACTQAPALTGDVTTFAGTCTTSIAALAVTNGQLAGSIAASKLIGTDIATVGTITAGTWNGTAVDVAHGGTGAATAANARTNLGVAIGSNVQAWDADLDAFALKTAPTGVVVGTTDTQTLTNKTLTAPAITSPTGIVKGDVGLGNVVNVDQTDAGNITSGTLGTARLPAPFTNGTASGSTSKFATTSGTLGTGCAQFDGGGNLIDVGSACGTGGGGSSVESCTTSASLGMDATGATANDTQLASWISSLSGKTRGCLEFGSGTFKFASAPVIPMPNALWSTSSTTSNTVAVGSKTFTVGSCAGINAGSTAYAWHSSLTATSILVGTVTSCSGTTLVMNVTSVSGSGTFSSWGITQKFYGTDAIGSITWKGQGVDTTVLQFATGANGPKFQFAGAIQQLSLSGMTIATEGASSSTACLILNNSYPFIGAQQNVNQIRNVTCRGSDGYGLTNYWGSGFVNQYVSNVNFDAIQVFGPAGASGTGTGMVFNNPGANGCVSNTTSPWQCGENYNITNSYFNNVDQGIYYGDNTQFVNVSNTQFLNSNRGIIVGGAGVLQGLIVANNIFFVYQENVQDNNGVKNIFLANNFFTTNPSHYAVVLSNNWNFTVTGNQFVPFQAGTSLGGLTVPGPSHGQSIASNNVFDGGGNTITNCLVVGASVTGMVATGNSFNGCTSTILNSAPVASNAIGLIGSGAPTANFTVYNGVVTRQ